MFRGKHWAKNVFSLTLRRVAVFHAVSRADFRVRRVHAAFLHVKAADCPFVASCRVAAALHGVPERVHRLNRLYITNNAALFSSTFLLMLCVSRACLGKIIIIVLFKTLSAKEVKFAAFVLSFCCDFNKTRHYCNTTGPAGVGYGVR
jgi:hypothetical protein